LSEKQQVKRTAYFEKQPVIQVLDEFKAKLHRLLLKKQRTKKQCARLLPIFLKRIEQLKQSGFALLRSLGKTLESWSEEIVRMWRFTKSNGITEGFHRKMKLIQRRAYGFRNFENYRLRVKVLCS
jgi:transposase